MGKHIIWLFLGIGSSWSCNTSDEQPTVDKWNIEWQFDEQVMTGILIMRSDSTASIIVKEHDNALLPHPTSAEYAWSLSETNLQLTNKQSGFALNYNILAQDNDTYRLLFADEVYVNLSK